MALYVYLAVCCRPTGRHATANKIGCASDVVERLAALVAGGNDAWRMVLVIAVPASLSAGALARHWAGRVRKTHCLFKYGIDLARHFRLPYFIDATELADAVAEPPNIDFVSTVVAEQTATPPPDAETLAAVARALGDGTFATPTAEYERLSFARTARPRIRYRKPRPAPAPAVVSEPPVPAISLGALLVAATAPPQLSS